MDRHWDQMTKTLGRSLSNEIDLVLELYETSDKSPKAIGDLTKLADSRLKIKVQILSGQDLPVQGPIPFYSLFDSKMQQYLSRRLSKPFWVNSAAANDKVEIQVLAKPGLIFRFLAEEDRAYATGSPLLLALMFLSTIALSAVAVIFLRNQVRPIIELARAAQAFGLGRESANFRPRGAAEVQLAGRSFIEMKRRIARYVEQRTLMLAGVSHDLRTILTRFRLELALQGRSESNHALNEDVAEMQKMLEHYMNFVRGDGGESSATIPVHESIASVLETSAKPGKHLMLQGFPEISVQLKPNAFRRLMTNVVVNATRHAQRVQVSGKVIDERLWIYVDDDGPGIPVDRREDVFKPFFRMDEARNLDHTGTGLGLSIALDIAHAHGGDILLENSPLGGLRVAIKLPL